jgi:hypothetical protein
MQTARDVGQTNVVTVVVEPKRDYGNLPFYVDTLLDSRMIYYEAGHYQRKVVKRSIVHLLKPFDKLSKRGNSTTRF